MIRLFEGQHLRVSMQGQGPAFVTFDNFETGRRDFGQATPSAHALAGGKRCVIIQTTRNDWYLNPDLPAALKALQDVEPSGGRALGFSMGAHGALLFARACGVEDVVLVSPRLPAPAGWQGQAKVYAQPKDLDPHWRAKTEAAARNLPRGLILFDPLHYDDRLATRWLQSLNPRIEAVAVPFAGHPSASVFREAMAWGPLQAILLADPSPAKAIIRLRRDVRRRSPGYLQRLADWQAARYNRS